MREFIYSEKIFCVSAASERQSNELENFSHSHSISSPPSVTAMTERSENERGLNTKFNYLYKKRTLLSLIVVVVVANQCQFGLTDRQQWLQWLLRLPFYLIHSYPLARKLVDWIILSTLLVVLKCTEKTLKMHKTEANAEIDCAIQNVNLFISFVNLLMAINFYNIQP